MSIPNRVGQVWIQYMTYQKDLISRIFVITNSLGIDSRYQILILYEIEFPSSPRRPEISTIDEFFSPFEEWFTLTRLL